jgi:hypothetical protein
MVRVRLRELPLVRQSCLHRRGTDLGIDGRDGDQRLRRYSRAAGIALGTGYGSLAGGKIMTSDLHLASVACWPSTGHLRPANSPNAPACMPAMRESGSSSNAVGDLSWVNYVLSGRRTPRQHRKEKDGMPEATWQSNPRLEPVGHFDDLITNKSRRSCFLVAQASMGSHSCRLAASISSAFLTANCLTA